MDPDEISRLVNELKLSHIDPTDAVKLEETDLRIGEERLAQCLVAKVLSAKAINREAFRQQMPRVLQAERRIDIEATGDNSFVFVFYSLRDRHRALTEGPWNFARNLLIFKEPIGRQHPRTMTFDETNFWVQLHNIPLAFMNEELLLKLGRQIGPVVELDKGVNGAFLGQFARIRIRINITQPLRKCIRVNAMRDEEDQIILLVYERIPDFCYACGRLGHSCRECDDSMADKENLSYGVWMRASTHLVRNRATKGSGTRTESTGNGTTNHDDSEQQPKQTLVNLALGKKSVVTPVVGPYRESNSTRLHNVLNKGPNVEADRIPQVASLNLVAEKSPTKSQPTMQLVVPDVAILRSAGLNLDQGNGSGPKQWKRRAREQHRKGTESMVVSESNSSSGDKRNAQIDSDTSAQEYTSPIKKRAKRVEEIMEATDIAAVVAVQPRRQQ